MEGVAFRIAAVFEVDVIADANALGQINVVDGACGIEDEKLLIAPVKLAGP